MKANSLGLVVCSDLCVSVCLVCNVCPALSGVGDQVLVGRLSLPPM